MKKIIILMLFSLYVICISMHAANEGVFGWLARSVKLIKDAKNLVIGSSNTKSGKAVNKKNKYKKERIHNVKQINAETMEKILEKYGENSAAAYSGYENKWYKFCGTVTSLSTSSVINTNEWALVWVKAKNSKKYSETNRIQCWGNFDPNFAKSLRSGEKVTVIGRLKYQHGNHKLSFMTCQIERS